jgi:hypothetical protein
MLTSLPKLADRSFVLGTFIPTMLFAVALLLEFNDRPESADLLQALAKKDFGQAIYLLFAVWACAVFVLMLNYPIYRFLEGYMFPSWLAEPLKNNAKYRHKKYMEDIEAIYRQYERQQFLVPEEEKKYSLLRQKRFIWMPSMTSDILPTRFGNAIKAFEVYPRDIYGADAITIWLRLTSVIPRAFNDVINNVRSQIDFLVNCCFFAFIVSIVGVCRVISSVDMTSGLLGVIHSIKLIWVFWALGGALASYAFYRWAVTYVPRWGDLVRSAFDCYLPALAAQLGFVLPATEAERRVFWTTFSQQSIYGREANGTTPFVVEEWTQLGPKPQRPSENSEDDEGDEGEDD